MRDERPLCGECTAVSRERQLALRVNDSSPDLLWPTVVKRPVWVVERSLKVSLGV